MAGSRRTWLYYLYGFSWKRRIFTMLLRIIVKYILKILKLPLYKQNNKLK